METSSHDLRCGVGVQPTPSPWVLAKTSAVCAPRPLPIVLSQRARGAQQVGRAATREFIEPPRPGADEPTQWTCISKLLFAPSRIRAMAGGEETQAAGRQAAKDAKRWLADTTRVSTAWLNPEALARLQFDWPGVANHKFSFDIGGMLRGDPFHNQEFFGEVKGYHRVSEAKQSDEYVSYLAKCYAAYRSAPARCDHFMWITWTPFRIHAAARNTYRPWPALWSGREVRKAVVRHRSRVFGPNLSVQDALALATIADCNAVAERLWVIVLHEKQEQLTILKKHRRLVYAAWSKEES
jgi:hypothetical protein